MYTLPIFSTVVLLSSVILNYTVHTFLNHSYCVHTFLNNHSYILYTYCSQSLLRIHTVYILSLTTIPIYTVHILISITPTYTYCVHTFPNHFSCVHFPHPILVLCTHFPQPIHSYCVLASNAYIQPYILSSIIATACLCTHFEFPNQSHSNLLYTYVYTCLKCVYTQSHTFLNHSNTYFPPIQTFLNHSNTYFPQSFQLPACVATHFPNQSHSHFLQRTVYIHTRLKCVYTTLYNHYFPQLSASTQFHCS